MSNLSHYTIRTHIAHTNHIPLKNRNVAIRPVNCVTGTWPPGDIVLEDGSSLRILCILNKTFIEASFPGKNSSDLVFFKGHRQIEPEFISVLNDTTIQLDVSRPPPENAMYYCKLRLDKTYDKDYEAVCLNKVVVGYKPQAENFTCMSQNWENLTCSWDPRDNNVDTVYSVTFKLPGRAGGRKVYPCPSDARPPEPGKDKPRNRCFWDSTTNPIYRQPYEYYTFHLIGENVLGNWSYTHKFHHFAYVIPARPTNLTVVNKTLDSVMLHWSVPFPMQTFPAGLHHRVAHQNQWDGRKTWQIVNITDEPHNPKRYYSLTGLQYANAIYDVRVYIKSAVASGDDKWSNFSGVTFRTPARVPSQSPRTDVGSFEVSENNINRDVYLYWQSIPAHLENGNNFRYQVIHVEENGQRIGIAPNEITRTYAKFRGLAHHSSYHFEIVSSNDVGIFDKPTKVFVPSRYSIPKEPIAFTKIAFDDGLYELSWKPPIGGDDEITNYTIFWCENDRDRPYQCQGYLEWLHVSKMSTAHNVTVPDPKRVYQFAISANTQRASSGMVWASCTVIHNKVVGKMKTVWINHMDSTFIDVSWKLDCSDRIGIVEGFKIYYCPIVAPRNLNCNGPKLNTTIKADVNTVTGKVTGLKPYTTYMIAVAILTKNGEGQHSDPLYNTTYESAPSDPPRDIVVHNVTNTTMYLEWKSPVALNGMLRYYVVHYNEHRRVVNEVPRVELRGLQANRNYSLRVSACTVNCSAESEAVHILTGIGVPGRITPPTVRFVNSSQVRLLWMRPQLPAGPLDYFQIKSNDGEIQNTTSLEASLSIPDCKTVGREKLYTFQVRAVNIAPNSEHLFGNWSDAGEGNCFSNGPSYRVWIIIWVIGSICGIAFVFCVGYSSKRLWLKCKAMQDVEVKLPPGLAPNMKLLQKSGEQHTRQSSADSSGCSSGQESVTSSLTSDSQVSSDSGAEVDPVVPKKLALDAPTATAPAWESSSLRQRNVAGATKPSLEATATRWEPYVKVAKGSNELIIPTTLPADTLSLVRSTPNLSDNIGYVTSQQTWSSTGYISMPSSEEMSNNSSPVPKENPNAGSYSVVGVISKSPIRCKSEEESISLSKTRSETENKTTTNPYVSLVSLEQKSKDNTKRAIDSLRMFEDLGLDKSKQQPQQPEKLWRPYVQTGFLEVQKPPATSLDARRQPEDQPVAKFTIGQQQEAKPYVTVASIAEGTARKPEPPTAAHKPYVPVTSFVGGNSEPKPTGTVFQMLQQSKSASLETSGTASSDDHDRVGLYPSLDLEATRDDESSSTSSSSSASSSSTSSSPTSSFVLCWQPGDPDAPKDYHHLHQQQQQQLSSPPTSKPISGYVTLPEQQHQPKYPSRFAKPQPPQQQPQQQQQLLPAQSDEQYSKVAVVPRTTH
ncbi:PREDICTED: cytokine receptor [Ceratosolen solmsi marchali]|uniref:Cytokine receptor n=1 Tax=Ceratosolen solmsi marchali TaxID=326594 RepID=A0AAJ6YQE8_9HYME|nr:PREDICTED: cytokine receptor [Ceratosolen solmsi marchali]